MNEIKRGTKYEICEGKYPNWYGEVMAVSHEIGMALTRCWFGNHYGEQRWEYLDDLVKERPYTGIAKCEKCGQTLKDKQN